MKLMRRGFRWAMSFIIRASYFGSRTGPHLTRFAMYKRLKVIAAEFPKGGRVLSVSGSLKLCDVLRLAPMETIEADYPHYTLLKLGFPEQAFDYVIADQVLEHVEGNPIRAIQEVGRVLKPGGIAVLTTCFLNPIHWGPADFWRFSPECLRYLAEHVGEVIEAGGWGNPAVLPFITLGLRHEPIPLLKWHPLHLLATWNKPAWPVVTWVVCRKA